MRFVGFRPCPLAGLMLLLCFRFGRSPGPTDEVCHLLASPGPRSPRLNDNWLQLKVVGVRTACRGRLMAGQTDDDI